MDDIHKNRIIQNIDQLLRLTAYEQLLKQCQHRQLLTTVMIKEIEKNNANEDTKHKNLLLKITKRGPNAFRVLLEICSVSFEDAYKLLNPNSPPNLGQWRELHQRPRVPDPSMSEENEVPPPETLTRRVLEPHTAEVFPAMTLTVKKSTKFHSHPKVSTYAMKSKYRGVLFLVNIINFKTKEDRRNGAEQDRDNLISLFRQMNFEIFYYEDIDYRQMTQLLEELNRSFYLKRTDSFVFGMMTHGSYINGRGYVQFRDDGFVDIEHIIRLFFNDQCELLRYKPKVFLFPFCRGDRPDRGVVKYRPGHQVEHDCSVPGEEDVLTSTKSDILVCYATVPGFVTHRDRDLGSWYIQELCTVFADHAHDTDIEVMLKIVGAKIVSYRDDRDSIQTPCFESWGFNKALYFNPGM